MSEWVSFEEAYPEAGRLVYQYIDCAEFEDGRVPEWAFPGAIWWDGTKSRYSYTTHWRYVEPPVW